MSKEVDRTISAWCSDTGAALTVSFDATQITEELKTNVEKRLLKKGVAVRWNNQEAASDLVIRVVAMDQGNQFLRWLLPFIAPAVLEVEGQVGLDGSAPRPFHYNQRAQMGLLGGSGAGNAQSQRATSRTQDRRGCVEEHAAIAEDCTMIDATIRTRSKRQWEAEARARVIKGEPGSGDEADFVKQGLDPESSQDYRGRSRCQCAIRATGLLLGSGAARAGFDCDSGIILRSNVRPLRRNLFHLVRSHHCRHITALVALGRLLNVRR